MGRRTSYAPGTFSWVDLRTIEPAVAKAFYSGVFGWEMEDGDGGAGAVATTCRLDGDAVCGLYEAPEDHRTTHPPATWVNHVTVEDADATAARASEVGGEVAGGAFDVPDLGRMAVVEDPQGAVVAVWEPGTRIGAERVNDVGCLCMNELATTDRDAACSFYARLFGWTTDTSGTAPDGPWMVLNGGQVNAAVLAAPPGTGAHWRPCFTVDSIERTAARVRELGGQRVGEPLDVGHGSVAMVRDPQGALFTVFAGETDA